MKYLRRWRRRSRAGMQVVERCDEAGRRPLAVRGDRAGHRWRWRRGRPRPPRAASAIAASPSPLSTQSMAPSPCSRMARAMKEALWPPTQMKRRGSARLGRLGEIDDLRDVGEVVAGERDDVRPPLREHAEDSRAWLSTCRSMSRTSWPARRAACRDQLEPERLEPQKDLGVDQRTGMNEEDLHRDTQQPEDRPGSNGGRAAHVTGSGMGLHAVISGIVPRGAR